MVALAIAPKLSIALPIIMTVPEGKTEEIEAVGVGKPRLRRIGVLVPVEDVGVVPEETLYQKS